MKSRQTLILSSIAAFTGACAMFVYLTTNDPDKATLASMYYFAGFVLFPAALIFASWPRPRFWWSLPAMVGGIFMGACVRMLIPPTQSNIWPIAAAFWTAIFFLPVLVGTLLGRFGSWVYRKATKR